MPLPFRWSFCSLVALTWLMPSVEASAVDYLAAAISGDAATLCGRVSMQSRSREEPPQVKVEANYPQFDAPRSAAERFYNEWVTGLVARMSFEGQIVIPPGAKDEEVLAIESLYLSSKLMSARASTWICCGAHGYSISTATNLDIERGAMLDPRDLFRLDAVADFCWRQFSEFPDQGGEDFKRDVPRESAAARFASMLRDQQSWSFIEPGAAVDFGYFRAYAFGPYVCEIGKDDLRALARPNAVLPF
jgi:hypothetical protein